MKKRKQKQKSHDWLSQEVLAFNNLEEKVVGSD